MRRVAVSFAVATCWVLCWLAPAGADDSFPKNGKISFTNYDAIYTVEPDGSNPRPLIKDAYLVDRPVWSPDGTKIVFTHQQESTQSHLISVMNADGSDLRALHTKVNQFASPTWSPDGTKLAFSKGTGPTYANDIFMMDLDGSTQINVTKTPDTVEANPEFSPDGSQMCHYRGAGGLEEGMFVTNVDSSNPIRLIDSRGVECAWSPDGKRIVTQHYGSSISDEFEVYVMNADGSGKTNLTSNRARDENLDWSPDGTKITFASDRDGDYDIYTMDADGSDVVQVTNLPGDDLFPDWQPLPRPTSSKDADASDVTQGTRKRGVEDEDRDRPERTVIVKPGNSLWSISEVRLGPEASQQQVYDHTSKMYAVNRNLIGANPNLIFVGQRLSLPPLGEG